MRIVWSRQKSASDAAIFIDRDGVINCRRANDYVLDWSQFVFMDGIRVALRELASLGLPMILISNQSALGRGLLRDVELEDITQRMWKILEQDGTLLSAAYFCPHRPDEKCACRKPQPGLLKQAAADFGIDLSHSVLIGDSDTDVKAAQAVGCHPVLFGPGHTACTDTLQWMRGLPVAHTAENLFQVTVGTLQKANPAAFSAEIVSPRLS